METPTDATITPGGLRLDGTLYPLDTVREALRAQQAYQELARRVAEARAVREVSRHAHARLAGIEGQQATRIRQHLEVIEAEAWDAVWGAMGHSPLDDETSIRRVPRRGE